MPYLSIKVIPNSNVTEFREVMSDGTQKIAVKAQPEKGKANKELIRFFKKEKGQNIEIVSGGSGRKKLIKIL